MSVQGHGLHFCIVCEYETDFCVQKEKLNVIPMSEDQEHYQRDFFAMLEVLDFQHLIMTTNASPSSC